MSPTARNQNCEDLQDGGFPIFRTQKLEASELQALYGEDGDYSCSPDDEELQAEVKQPDEHIAEESVNEFTYLSEKPPHSHHQLYRPAHPVLRREVFFSNKAYYCKLEELKKIHLQNIADLQNLYLDQLASAQRDRLPEDKDQNMRKKMAPRPQPRDNAHQKLIDSCDTSLEEQVSEPEDDPEWKNHYKELHVKQALLTPPLERNWCPFLKISTFPSLANQNSRQVVKVDTRRRGSKVTTPQPFQMTLREEERKIHRVKTRSEVEMENERLRKELDELKECGRKFRATPAPASTHLAPYEIVKMCPGQRQPGIEHGEPHVDSHHENHSLQKKPSRGRSLQKNSQGRCVQGKASPRHHPQDKQFYSRRFQGKRHSAPSLPQQPFSFIERERKKKEMKLLAELNNLTPREERRVFKARPVPRSLYQRNSQDFQLYGAITLHSRAQEHRLNSTASFGCLEVSQQVKKVNEEEGDVEDRVFLPHRAWGDKSRSTEKVKKERNAEREKDWSYIHPLRRASVSCSHEVLPACKSDYISV